MAKKGRGGKESYILNNDLLNARRAVLGKVWLWQGYYGTSQAWGMEEGT